LLQGKKCAQQQRLLPLADLPGNTQCSLAGQSRTFGIQQKVVAIIPLPEKLLPGGREHHGAAEAESESKGQGKSSTDSVPAYTSPEGIK
jgi:hypothetical protein